MQLSLMHNRGGEGWGPNLGLTKSLRKQKNLQYTKSLMQLSLIMHNRGGVRWSPNLDLGNQKSCNKTEKNLFKTYLLR